MFTLIFWLLNVSTIVFVYVFWVRPLLKRNPALAELYAREGAWWTAFSAKFVGIKQKLTAALVYAAGSFVFMYDYISPKLTGVDITPLTSKITAHVPTAAWPIIAIAFTALLDYFRYLADKRSQ